MSNKDTDGDVAAQSTPQAATPTKQDHQLAEEEEAGPWDCTVCGHTNASPNSRRCTGPNPNPNKADTKCMAWRGGKRLQYYKKIKDVLVHILEKKNEVETKAADAYIELFPDGADMLKDKDKSASSPPPSSPPQRSTGEPSAPFRTSPRHEAVHFAWKDERTHYEKLTSRIGSEFQVDFLPAAGSYTDSSEYPSNEVADGGKL